MRKLSSLIMATLLGGSGLPSPPNIFTVDTALSYTQDDIDDIVLPPPLYYNGHILPDKLVSNSSSNVLPTIRNVMRVAARRDDEYIQNSANAYEKRKFDISEIECLATNIYHEARGEGRIGMVAVGWTTINRRNSAQFPNTICEVVYQPSQFAWINEGHTAIYERDAFANAMDAAAFLYNNELTVNDYTGGSLYFLSPMNNPPNWSHKFSKTFTYKRHTFYRP